MGKYIVTINEESSEGKAILTFIKTLSYISIEKEETYLKRIEKTSPKIRNSFYLKPEDVKEDSSKKFLEDFWAEDSENV